MAETTECPTHYVPTPCQYCEGSKPTPADELRTAAARLRSLATAASTTDGTPTARWNTGTENQGRTGLTGLYGDYTTDGRQRRIGWPPLMHGATRPAHMHPQHAKYAVAMRPALGLLLADWLDAEVVHRHAVDVGQPCPDVSTPSRPPGRSTPRRPQGDPRRPVHGHRHGRRDHHRAPHVRLCALGAAPAYVTS